MFSQRSPARANNKLGFSNSRSTCYMNSTVSAMYNVMPIRKAFMDTNHPDTVSTLLSSTFNQMQNFETTRSTSTAIDLAFTLGSHFRTLPIAWSVGQFHCSNDFWTYLSEKFPPQIQNLFKVEYRAEYHTVNDGTILKTERYSGNNALNYYQIHITDHGDLISFLNSNAESTSKAGEGYKINKNDPTQANAVQYLLSNQYAGQTIDRIPESVMIPTKNYEIIESTSDIFVGAIGRINAQFNSKKFTLPDQITINGDNYELRAFVAFSPPVHYISFCKDPATNVWYKYDDSVVEVADVNSEQFLFSRDNAATLIFYVKISVLKSAARTALPPINKNMAILSGILNTMGIIEQEGHSSLLKTPPSSNANISPVLGKRASNNTDDTDIKMISTSPKEKDTSSVQAEADESNSDTRLTQEIMSVEIGFPIDEQTDDDEDSEEMSHGSNKRFKN